MSRATASPSETRSILLARDCCRLPEKLLLAHARGEVLFITGAGTSMQAKLPDFRTLTLDVYGKLDRPLYNALCKIPRGACNLWDIPAGRLKPNQLAEARRFVQGDFDVALGMLERRLDSIPSAGSKVRKAIDAILRGQPGKAAKPASIHHALVKLSDRGAGTAVVTTNFDLLLEDAARGQKKRLETYSLASMPRPGRAEDFAGILHLHGALERDPARSGYFVVSDRDFGEYYLRRQVIPDFIYDAARLFNIVLVGYSANDPPMRYLLNAVAADGTRFSDLRDRYAFVAGASSSDPVVMSDWHDRGIIPIPYDSSNDHKQLGDTLHNWAQLSAINGNRATVHSLARKITRKCRASVSDVDRDLFDHLFRRSNDTERRAIANHVSSRADPEWLSAMLAISSEPRQELR